MSRLDEIKDEIAQELGYNNWNVLRAGNMLSLSFMLEHQQKANDRYTIECCKASLEKASEKTTEQYVRPITLNYGEIKNLIINPDNIILL